MIINPKVKGFVLSAAHPLGCAANVVEQIEYVKSKGDIPGSKRVLIIGASAGFGLSTRITSAFGSGASTIGVIFDRPPSPNQTAWPGWYNTAAFEDAAHKAGLYAKTINGDAYQIQTKKDTIALIKEDLGQVDMVVYSVAAPRRLHPYTGRMFKSVLKPIGEPYTNKTFDPRNGEILNITIPPSKDGDIENTVAVMGGEDWKFWIKALKDADALAPDCLTLAFSYIGPEMTFPLYKDGTIGKAKDHLEETAKELTKELEDLNGKAFVSVNKALVTQSGAAIPVFSLYVSILYKVMKEKGTHEGCIEQIQRLFAERLFTGIDVPLDAEGRIRVDDWELDEDVQAEVTKRWAEANTQNLRHLADMDGYQTEFKKLFGFGFDTVNYNLDSNPMYMIPSLLGSHLEHMMKTTTKMKLSTYESADQYAIITMHNGKANVFSHELIAELNEALDMAEKDKKVVIITGQDGIFSGGFDLKVMMKSVKDARALVTKGSELCQRLLSFPYPVIMACSGHAIAQGAFMLLSADYRIGAKGQFRIGLNEVLIGLTMHHAGIALGRFKLTPRYLDRSMNNAELYTPENAVEAGFLDETVPASMLLPTAIKLARMMAKFNMKAHQGTKLNLRKELLEALSAAIEKDR